MRRIYRITEKLRMSLKKQLVTRREPLVGYFREGSDVDAG
jgi:hypothetical protein